MGDELVVRAAGKKIGLDVLGGEICYISHAHSDHSSAVGGPLPIFCSDATADLLKLSADGRMDVPEGIELHSAGHILGSTQLAGDGGEAFGRLAYTGDFKLRDGLTVKAAPILSCDTLMAECTYGDPAVSFPPVEEVYGQMERWARQHGECIQLWGGYATGKAQELVKFLNMYAGVVPVVSPRIAQVCGHYAKHGVKMEWLASDGAEAQEVMRGPFASVLPPHQLQNGLAGRLAAVHRRPARVAMATGWALVRRLRADAAFALSDHADYGQLLEYAQTCGAKRIYLAHGENEKTAAALRAAGLEARAVGEMEEAVQMKLKAVVEK